MSALYIDQDGSPCVVEECCPACGQDLCGSGSDDDDAGSVVVSDGSGRSVAGKLFDYDGIRRMWGIELDGLDLITVRVACRCGSPLTLDTIDFAGLGVRHVAAESRPGLHAAFSAWRDQHLPVGGPASASLWERASRLSDGRLVRRVSLWIERHRGRSVATSHAIYIRDADGDDGAEGFARTNCDGTLDFLAGVIVNGFLR